jgi:predicted site-specific integrase-resolvase
MGASSIAKFCQDHGISRGTFYNLVKRGEAPRTMKVGGRKLISEEAAADWRRLMETPAPLELLRQCKTSRASPRS